jgi:hypothetical protein
LNMVLSSTKREYFNPIVAPGAGTVYNQIS